MSEFPIQNISLKTEQRSRKKLLSLPNIRMLTRTEAAEYCGVSASHFDNLIKQGVLPPSVSMGSSKRWDINKIDQVLSELDVQLNDNEDPFELAFNSNY